MKTLFEAAGELQEFLAGKHWKFCFIGGIALQRWGEPRLTLDADISLLTGLGREEEVARQGAALDKKAVIERLKPLAAIKTEEDILDKTMPILGEL